MIKNLFGIFFFKFILFSCTSVKKEIKNKNEDRVIILSDIPGLGKDIKNHYKITVHYKGMFEDGTVFDSSYKKQKPFTFQYGLRQVIEGWEIGLNKMKEGGKRKISIPSSLAYGKKGIKNLIPPNSLLIFEIEILKIQQYDYMLITNDVLVNYKKEKMINFKNNLILIDIRNKDKISETGMITNSFHISAFDNNYNLNKNFLKNLSTITKDDDHIVLIDQNGEFSTILANGLVENIKMKNIYSLKNGINGWMEKKYKLFK